MNEKVLNKKWKLYIKYFFYGERVGRRKRACRKEIYKEGLYHLELS